MRLLQQNENKKPTWSALLQQFKDHNHPESAYDLVVWCLIISFFFFTCWRSQQWAVANDAFINLVWTSVRKLDRHTYHRARVLFFFFFYFLSFPWFLITNKKQDQHGHYSWAPFCWFNMHNNDRLNVYAGNEPLFFFVLSFCVMSFSFMFWEQTSDKNPLKNQSKQRQKKRETIIILVQMKSNESVRSWHNGHQRTGTTNSLVMDYSAGMPSGIDY